MTDIFKEVEEDSRRARFEALWKRHGNVVVGAAILLVLAVAGFRYWSHLDEQRAAAAGARFYDAAALSREGKSAEAEKALESLMTEAPSGYRALLRMRFAAELGQRDPAAGANAFDALANDGSLDKTMRDLARLRAAMLILDRVDPKEIATRVEPLAKPDNPWRHTARELLGVAALKARDYEAAGRWFDQIIVDPQVPSGLRQRTQQTYLPLVRAGPVTSAPTQ